MRLRLHGLLCVLVGLFVLGLPAGAFAAGACPNEGIREAQGSAFLPECRAYEMVSPVDKNGGDVMANQMRTRSARDGNAIQYASTTAFADAFGTSIGVDYIAQRGADGWATHAITPAQDPDTSAIVPISENQTNLVGELSPDLATGVMYARRPLTEAPNVALTSNLYLRRDFLSSGPGTYQLISDSVNPLPHHEGPIERDSDLVGTSEDFHHIVFETADNLTPDASGEGWKMYEFENGTLRLAGVLPNGEPAPLSLAGHDDAAHVQQMPYTPNAVSRDGSRVFFTDQYSGRAAGANSPYRLLGHVYMREDHARTVQLDAFENGEVGSTTAGFWAATPDGSKVLIDSEDSLTEDSVGIAGTKLYMYDVNAPVGHHLTLISQDQEPADGTRVDVSEVLGMSEDGSYVYFGSGGDRLASGQPESTVSTVSGWLSGSTQEVNSNAIYVWHDGTVRYVGNHATRETSLYAGPDEVGDPFRVSLGGMLVYTSRIPQTTYSSACPGGPREGHCQEVYLYDPPDGHVRCVSCDPSGAPPMGDAGTVLQAGASAASGRNQHLSHVVTDDGSKVFFDSPDPLVAQDANGRYDVYEYDVASGEVHLISTGHSNADSLFAEATPNGSDVFFVTHQQLVGMDIDGEYDLYDARIGGGIAAQDRRAPTGCVGDACQEAPNAGAGSFGAPASMAFSGGGNATVAPPPLSAPVKSKSKPKPRKRRKAKKRHGRARSGRVGKARGASVIASRSTGR